VSTLRLGSRGSPLALFQANLVAARIQSTGGPRCDVVVIKTSGDRLQERPLSEIGGKRLFVKEIEDALLSGDIDLAVHSSKDMPAVLPDGLDVGAALEREDPRDVLVLGDRRSPIVRIGTGSVRRIAQLKARFPRASFENVRGNLDTRLRKLDGGEYNALVLAAAGLRRLGLGSRASEPLSIDECVPAPGQGIIAVEIRIDDRRAGEAAARITDADATASLEAERSLVSALGGGCQMPIGAIAEPAGSDALEMHAVVASLDGTRVIRYKKVGTRRDPAGLGREVADELLRLGASDILSNARSHALPADPNTLRLT
jgi:hydroxymethylbilane synthase